MLVDYKKLEDLAKSLQVRAESMAKQLHELQGIQKSMHSTISDYGSKLMQLGITSSGHVAVKDLKDGDIFVDDNALFVVLNVGREPGGITDYVYTKVLAYFVEPSSPLYDATLNADGKKDSVNMVFNISCKNSRAYDYITVDVYKDDGKGKREFIGRLPSGYEATVGYPDSYTGYVKIDRLTEAKVTKMKFF